MNAPVSLAHVDADPRLDPYRAEASRTQERADAAWCALYRSAVMDDDTNAVRYAAALAAQEEHDQALAKYYEEESALYPTIIT